MGGRYYGLSVVSVNTALALSVYGVVGAFGGEDLRADWGLRSR